MGADARERWRGEGASGRVSNEQSSVLEARVLARAPRNQSRRGALGSTQGAPISTGRAEAATPQAGWTPRQDR
jgi:hypothetical protein